MPRGPPGKPCLPAAPAQWGAGTFAGADGSRMPTDIELGYARHQARPAAQRKQSLCPAGRLAVLGGQGGLAALVVSLLVVAQPTAPSPNPSPLPPLQGKYFAEVTKKLAAK